MQNKQKKLLVITENIGKSAPGIVFERLINEVSTRHQVDILCLQCETQHCLHNVENIYLAKIKNKAILFISQPRIKNRVSKYSLKFFGNDLGTRLTASQLWRKLSSESKNFEQYDAVLTMVSNQHISPLLVAEKIKRRNPGTKNITYCVDAVPAPFGWSTDYGEFIGMKKFISNRLVWIDALFSSNHKMLDYQLSVGRKSTPNLRGVAFTPSSGQRQILPQKTQDRYNFLYTGTIYGKRTAKHVLSALKIVLKRYPDTYIIFVGTKFRECDFAMLTDFERTHVEVHPHTADLNQFYVEATALLDIDADLEDDVFLSSKVINYLMLNRLIISETGKNSPAEYLFKDIASVLQCGHNSEEIAEAMCNAIQISDDVSFSDRERLISILSVQAAADSIDTAITAPCMLPN